MKTLYIECNMGAAGDMLTAALLVLVENKEKTLAEMNAFGIPGVRFECEDSIKCGIKGTHMRVYINGEEEECEEEYCPSSTNGDYSPSCPWNAPGMSIKDFI